MAIKRAQKANQVRTDESKSSTNSAITLTQIVGLLNDHDGCLAESIKQSEIMIERMTEIADSIDANGTSQIPKLLDLNKTLTAKHQSDLSLIRDTIKSLSEIVQIVAA